jgi:hypothetical protein
LNISCLKVLDKTVSICGGASSWSNAEPYHF